MVRHAVVVALTITTLAPLQALADTTIPLASLEAQVTSAPAVTIAKLGEAAQSAMLDSDRAHRGPQLSAGANVGAYRELITNTQVHNYTGVTGSLGVRFPLGSSLEEQEALLKDAGTLAERHVDIETARQSVLSSLRTYYAAYWAARRKAALSQTYLDNESELDSALSLRVRSHQALASEQLEIESNYESVRRDQLQFTQEADHVLAELSTVSGQTLAPFVPEEPQMLQECETSEAFAKAALEANPGLIALSEQLQQAKTLAADASHTPLDAGLSLGHSTVAQVPAGAGPGFATTVGVDVRVPLNTHQVMEAEHRRYDMLAQQSQAQIALQSSEVANEAANTFALQRQSLQNVELAQARRLTASEALREHLLRYGRIGNETPELLAKGRYDFYQAALAEADAQAALVAQGAQAAAMSGGHCASFTASPALSMYVWKSEPLLEDNVHDASFWDNLADEHISSLLISFNKKQLNAMNNDGHGVVNAFIAVAHAHHVQVELLLGDPNWLLPESRDELLTILRSLSKYPFDGLNLDIEPGQLASLKKPNSYLYGELTRTLQAAGAVSPWPLAVSVNYRDMTHLSLEGTKVRTVTLMTYVSNPSRVASLVRPILQAHPNLHFQVAQSVEPSLSTEESYASKGRGAFTRSLARLGSMLSEPNYAGTVVQSYDDYKAMKP